MKKQQKIIELRTAAELKVAEIETRIAVARSEAAEKRARLMCDRAADLAGLEAGSKERFDALAKYRSQLSWIEAHLAATVAECKLEIQQVKAECEKQCATAAEDDPEPANEQPQPQQETVYCDGSEHSARIVARRLINKMPHIPKDGMLYVHVVEDTYGDKREYFVSVIYGDKLNHESEIFSAQRHTAEFEAAFMEKVRNLFNEEQESGNSHVAEPIKSVLDSVFGGNPMNNIPTLRKEGGDE